MNSCFLQSTTCRECKPCQPAPKVKDPKVAAELWELSLKMVKKEGENLMAAF